MSHYTRDLRSERLGRLSSLQRQECRAVASLVSQRKGVAVPDLLMPTRGCRHVAEARQMAMYLCHTLLHLTQAQVGYFFHRDRTTVGHACALVEDLRDDPAVEALLDELAEEIKFKQMLAAGGALQLERDSRHAFT